MRSSWILKNDIPLYISNSCFLHAHSRLLHISQRAFSSSLTVSLTLLLDFCDTIRAVTLDNLQIPMYFACHNHIYFHVPLPIF